MLCGAGAALHCALHASASLLTRNTHSFQHPALSHLLLLFLTRQALSGGKGGSGGGGPAAHSASLTLGQAIWEYLWDARWSIFLVSLLIFLACQGSRQVADYFIRWWTRDEFGKYKDGCVGPDCGGGIFYVRW